MAHNALANPIPAGAKRARRPIAVSRNAAEAGIARFLRSFQALLVATPLYQKNHPLALSALEGAELHLRAALVHVSPISIGVENGAMVYSPSKGADPVPLESDESLATVAEDWRRRGLRSLIFLPSTNLSELDSLARLWHTAVNWTGPRAADEWSTQFAAMRIAGIRANVPLRQRTGTILATLVSVLVAHGGDAESGGSARNAGGNSGAGAIAGDATSPANFEDLTAALRILARLEPIAGRAGQSTPQQTAEVVHTALADAERRTLSQLIRAMSQAAPRETESVERYLARISESLLIETLIAQFLGRRLPATEVRDIFKNLADAVAQALRSLAETDESARIENRVPTALVHAARALVPNMEKDDSGGAEIYVESLHERFWDELPAREKAALLRGADAWCVPVIVIGRHIERLLDAGHSSHGDAPVRESRILIANYARALEAEQPRARRAAAGGLAEMLPVIAKLWMDASPVELDRMAVRSLIAEESPGIAGMSVALVEKLACQAMQRNNFAEFERILAAIEAAPRDADHSHLSELAARLADDSNWSAMVNASLAVGPLDPALPRLLRRAPERLVEDLGARLAAPAGPNELPAMARLATAAGEAVLGVLESHLADPRRQRAGTAIKLLAATEPQRLVNSLPRTLPGWDWNLQDLAVAELTRRDGAKKANGVARAFVAVLPEAHSLVAPMMLDEIGLAGESSAVPLLCEIAGGNLAALRDVFIRIKAIEALGRLRAAQAADLLRTLLRQRAGLVHTEPAGLRAAAKEALALIENHPSSARVRASRDAVEKASASFARPRRYLRIPLERPFAAQIASPVARAARVSSISLGGAFLESSEHLAVGDHIRVDIRAGLRHIHSTAIVRNVSPAGGGVEFLKMPDVDRERLRRLVRRLTA
jgi:hypothetical protein